MIAAEVWDYRYGTIPDIYRHYLQYQQLPRVGVLHEIYPCRVALDSASSSSLQYVEVFSQSIESVEHISPLITCIIENPPNCMLNPSTPCVSFVILQDIAFTGKRVNQGFHQMRQQTGRAGTWRVDLSLQPATACGIFLALVRPESISSRTPWSSTLNTNQRSTTDHLLL